MALKVRDKLNEKAPKVSDLLSLLFDDVLGIFLRDSHRRLHRAVVFRLALLIRPISHHSSCSPSPSPCSRRAPAPHPEAYRQGSWSLPRLRQRQERETGRVHLIVMNPLGGKAVQFV